MKSERRPETPASTLSLQPNGAVALYQKYGTRLMLAVTLAVLAVVIFRYRNAANERRAAEAQAALVRARAALVQLQDTLQAASVDPEIVAARRDQLADQTRAELNEVLADSDDSQPILRAEHYATRGDLNWTLANAPVYPQATTRPSLAVKQPAEDLLNNAESDYRHVIGEYPKQQTAWATAELGLAAIAENRHRWDDAAKDYHAVTDRTDAASVFKEIASLRLTLLDQIRNPVQLGSLTTQPTTQANAGATTQSVATSEPATQPAR